MKVRIPTTENEWEKELPLFNGCKVTGLNPGGPGGSGGTVSVGPPLFPGAVRHAAVPVNPYAPFRFGESAAADVAHINVRTDAAQIDACFMGFPLHVTTMKGGTPHAGRVDYLLAVIEAS